MEWDNSFEDQTIDDKFYLEDGTEKIVKTLYKTSSNDDVSFYEDDEVLAVRKDLKKYDDYQFDFMAIMPKEEKLSKFINTKFNEEYIKNIDGKLKNASSEDTDIRLNIPKFSYEYDLNLKEDLMKLGITDVFSSNADLSNISNSDLYVDDALHKANIVFSQKGIKAAATTAFTMKLTATVQNSKIPKVIKINKPFIFLIREKSTNDIWFVGTLFVPEANE
jgi:serpin B